MLNRAMLLAGVAGMALLAGPVLEAAGCGEGYCHDMYVEGCGSGEGEMMEDRGYRHSAMMGLGRYDLSEEDRARIDAILDEARAEIAAILTDYEPVGGASYTEGCHGCR